MELVVCEVTGIAVAGGIALPTAPRPAIFTAGDSSSEDGGILCWARLLPREGTDRLLERAYCDGRIAGRAGGSAPFAYEWNRGGSGIPGPVPYSRTKFSISRSGSSCSRVTRTFSQDCCVKGEEGAALSKGRVGHGCLEVYLIVRNTNGRDSVCICPNVIFHKLDSFVFQILTVLSISVAGVRRMNVMRKFSKLTSQNTFQSASHLWHVSCRMVTELA